MKYTFLLKNSACACVSEVTSDKPVTEAEVLKAVNANLKKHKGGPCEQLPFKNAVRVKRGQHICPYCEANVVKSPDKDLLCLECREDFGHAFYSEL